MEKEALAVVERFMRSSTVPLLYNANEVNHSWAGGTLFRIADRHFIVTARHIFDDIKPENLAYPEHRDQGGLRTIGRARIVKPDTAKIDVAVIELYDRATIEKLSTGWNFLTLDNVAPPTSMDGLFALMGYPSSMSYQRGEYVAANGLIFYTNQMQAPVDAPQLNPEIDLFFEYAKTALLEGNQAIDAPPLKGASGCAIWECVASGGGFWLPDKTVKVEGVQSAYLRGTYMRAVSWGAVGSVLGRMDAELERAVKQVVDIRKEATQL